MKTIPLSFLLLLFSLNLPAQSKTPEKPCIWPVANHKGAVKLMFGKVIQPKLNKEIFNEGIFIAVPHGTPILAISDGRITDVLPYVWMHPEMNYSITFQAKPDSATLKAKKLPESYVFGSVGIEIGVGEKIYYNGLLSEIPVKVGQRVKAGDTIGYCDHISGVFSEPVFQISYSKYGKPVDIGSLLFGAEYKPKEVKKQPPYDPVKTLTSVQLKEDFAMFRSALEEGHPGLYTYTPKPTFDSLFSATEKQLNQPMTGEKFAHLLLHLVARIGCGHTNLLFSPDYNKLYFPLDICFIDDRCFAIRDWSENPKVQPGDEIISINGNEIKQVLETLRSNCEGDGFNTTFKDYLINIYTKRMLYQQYGPLKTYMLKIRTAKGDTVTQTCTAIFREVLNNKKKAAFNLKPPSIRDAIEMKILDTGIAYMKISDFEVFNQDQVTGFFKMLEEKKISSILLDLRGNGGGTPDNLSFLFSFFANQPFNIYPSKMVKVRGKYHFFSNVSNYPSFEEMNMEYNALQGNDGYYLFPPLLEPVKEHHFDGKVYVLMDGGTFSAAASFCAMIHCQKRGFLMGEEAGGGYYQLNAEKFAFLQFKNLPGSLRIPLVKLKCTESIDPGIPAGHGVMPDCNIKKSPEDYLDTSRDRVLETALKNMQR